MATFSAAAGGARSADLVFAAPPDDLYLATEINDWAIAAANLTVREGTPADPTPLLPAWRDAITAELQPRVAALRGRTGRKWQEKDHRQKKGGALHHRP